MALFGFEVDDGPVDRVQVLPFDSDPRAATDQRRRSENKRKFRERIKGSVQHVVIVSAVLVEAAVGLDGEDLRRLLVPEHSGGGDAKLVDVDLQHDVLHLADGLRKARDGGQGLLDYGHAAGKGRRVRS